MDNQSKANILRVSNISVWYGGSRALEDVSLEINEGEIIAVVGSNGSGKSTLLKAIVGICRAKKGIIEFLGRTITELPTEAIVGMGLSMVPEGRGVLGPMTVLENLQMGAYRRSNKAEICKDLEDVMEQFPILAERKNQLGATLSGGEQQMLVMARALMARPRLILMDEPSLGLAPLIVNQIFDIIAGMGSKGAGLILVEQNARKALQCADRGYVLERGNVVLQGETADLQHNRKIIEAYLG